MNQDSTPQSSHSPEDDINHHTIISGDIPEPPPATILRKRKRSIQDHANSMFPNEFDVDRRIELYRMYMVGKSHEYRQRTKLKLWMNKSLELIQSKGYESTDNFFKSYGYVHPKNVKLTILLPTFLESELWKDKLKRNKGEIAFHPRNWPELDLRAAFAKAQFIDLQKNLPDVPGNELVVADTLPIVDIRQFLVNDCGMRLTDEIQQSNYDAFLRMKYACIMRLKKLHKSRGKQLRTFPDLVNEMEGNKMMSMLNQGQFMKKIEEKIIRHIKNERFGSSVLVDLVHGQKGGSLNYSCLQELHELNPDLVPAGNTVAVSLQAF